MLDLSEHPTASLMRQAGELEAELVRWGAAIATMREQHAEFGPVLDHHLIDLREIEADVLAVNEKFRAILAELRRRGVVAGVQ